MNPITWENKYPNLSLSSSPLLSFHSYRWSDPAEDREQEGPGGAAHAGRPPSAQSRVEEDAEWFLSQLPKVSVTA